MSTANFTCVRFREGYDIEEVDHFIETIEAALKSRQPPADLAEQIQAVMFSPRRFGRSYDMQEVDNYLEELHTKALNL